MWKVAWGRSLTIDNFQERKKQLRLSNHLFLHCMWARIMGVVVWSCGFLLSSASSVDIELNAWRGCDSCIVKMDI